MSLATAESCPSLINCKGHDFLPGCINHKGCDSISFIWTALLEGLKKLRFRNSFAMSIVKMLSCVKSLNTVKAFMSALFNTPIQVVDSVS